MRVMGMFASSILLEEVLTNLISPVLEPSSQTSISPFTLVKRFSSVEKREGMPYPSMRHFLPNLSPPAHLPSVLFLC